MAAPLADPMAGLIPVGRGFFAVASMGLAIEHFVFREFVTGRAPAWPASVPGGSLWAYLTGTVLLLAGAAILAGRRGRLAAVLVAGLVLLGALLRHLPVLATAQLLSGEWTRAGKALLFVGGALAIAATFPKLETRRARRFVDLVNRRDGLIVLGQACLGVFFVLTGIQHFLFTDFVASLIPSWFPGDPVVWTAFAGVALICGGLGLFVPRTARLAALLSAAMVFSWFWIVHLPRAHRGGSEAIAVFEALAVAGIALVLAGAAARPRRC